MEDTIVRRGVSADEDNAMARGGSAAHRVRTVFDPVHWEDVAPFLLLNDDWFSTGAFAGDPHLGMRSPQAAA